MSTSRDAGPSTYARHQQSASISTTRSRISENGSTTAQQLASPVSPRGDEPPTHVQAIHDFSPALLASTSSVGQNPNMYLSFKNGEVIRVHVRDATGWWDGEIATKLDGEEDRGGPRRGWFPSNYVREMGHDGTVRRRADSGARSDANGSPTSRKTMSINTVHSRHQSAASHMSRASSSTTASYAPSPTNRSMAILPGPLQSLLHPVVRALSLLDAAIHADKRPHIQPAAACVISAIRTVLLQTDCLNKDSQTLISFSPLGKERKIILAELSRLVNAARVCSGSQPEENLDDRTPEEQMRDLEKLAKAARAVFAGMKRFLQYCNDYNIEPDLTQSASMEPGESGMTTSGYPPSVDSDDPGRKPRVRHSSNEHSRATPTFKSRAASVGDLRSARRMASSPPPPLPQTAMAMSRGPSAVSAPRSPVNANATTPVSATFPSSSSGRSSPLSFRSKRERKTHGSIDSTSTHSHSPITETHSIDWSDHAQRQVPPTPLADRTLSSSVDVLEAISVAEDSVLSIIAAFIGHIHSHNMGSHPSSHAILIEMTRETIDCVRELLTVVEAVGRDPGVRRHNAREVEHMRLAKDTLYEVSNRLVEGVEMIAHAPFIDTTEEDYNTVKGQILSTATATLRAGSDCVRWVRLCVPEGSDAFAAATPTPRQSDRLTRQSTPRPLPQDAAVVLRDKIVGQRGTHTLSSLHRKASSLSLLHQRFKDGNGMQSTSEDADEDEEDEEVVEDRNTDEDLTVRHNLQGSTPFPNGPNRLPFIDTKITSTPGHSTPQSAGLLRTMSEQQSTPMPRSRSSSLSSPMPARMTHRSPSRSADLDKFTGDHDVQLPPRRPNNLRSATYQGMSSGPLTPGVDSNRTSGVSDQTTPSLLTPHSFDQGLSPQDGAFDNALSVEVPSVGALPKFASLSLDTTDHATKSQTLPRPPAPSRAFTAPMPASTFDVTFVLRSHDYEPREVTFNNEGMINGASLRALVEKMTPHDGPVEPTFWATFFYTFRLHTSPEKLVQALMARYDLAPPHGVILGEKEYQMWIDSKVVPIRLRIYNFLKAWLDTHWRAETDDSVLETLRQFSANNVARSLPAMAPRLDQAIRRRQAGPLSASSMSATDSRAVRRISSVDQLGRSASAFPPVHGGLPPTPAISRTLNSLLHKNPAPSSVPITDFDSLELARQLTIMESKLFCLVAPEDLLQSGWGKKSIPELKALSTLSNQITGWVADTILNEVDAKKRALLLKFYIKLSDKCLTLNNFSTMFAVMAGLNSSIVQRLKRTWDALSVKYRLIMERLQCVIDHTKNHAAYRARLREVEGPCLPFLGIILTDVTFTSDGNSDTRPSMLTPDLQLINQDKFAKLGRIAIEFGRYQQPFNLHELEIVQGFLKRTLAEQGSASLDALYGKSLMLEPRQGSERFSAAVEKPGWLGMGGRI